MIPLTILSFIFGVVLGLRFNPLALVPAMVLILISVAAAALAQGVDLWRPLGAIALTFIALQAGFFAGAFARPHFVARSAARDEGSKEGQPGSGSATPLRTTID